VPDLVADGARITTPGKASGPAERYATSVIHQPGRTDHPFGRSTGLRFGHPVDVHNGGSARGYQPGFALSALQETADVCVTDPYIYAPALAGLCPLLPR